MKTMQRLNLTDALAVLIGVVVLAFAGPATAASDCIHISMTDTSALCAGQRSTLRVDVENTCVTPVQFSLRFAMDQEALRTKAADVVPGGSTLSKQVLLPVPETMSRGSHNLTVTSIDVSGQVSATDANVTINRCESL
jgi:hypothetical protein